MSVKSVCDQCGKEIPPNTVGTAKVVFVWNNTTKPGGQNPWPQNLDFCGSLCAYDWFRNRVSAMER